MGSIDPTVTVAEQLQVAAMLKGFSVKQSKEVATAAMEKLGLGQYSQVLCGDLSGGNKRKVCIGVALTGNPQLVLMDEPTSGLDPGSRRQVWNTIRSTVGSGQAVLLTSHSMAEVDTLCDRLAILVAGRVNAEGSPDQLKQQFGGGYKVSLKLAAGCSEEEMAELLAGIPGVQLVGQRSSWLNYRVEGELSSVLGVLATGRNQGRLEGFTINMTSLDDIFLEVTSGGETRRLGTGETGPPLAEGGEGDQLYDPLKLSGTAGREESGGDEEEEAIYRRPGSLSTTSNASQDPPDPLLIAEQGEQRGGEALAKD